MSPRIDRTGGVIYAVLGVGGTVLAVLTGMVFLSIRRGHSLQVIARKAWTTLPLWGTLLLAVAALVGFCLGSDRTIRILGHLWFTEKPRNPGLSAVLWVGLLSISLAAYVLLVVRAPELRSP